MISFSLVSNSFISCSFCDNCSFTFNVSISFCCPAVTSFSRLNSDSNDFIFLLIFFLNKTYPNRIIKIDDIDLQPVVIILKLLVDDLGGIAGTDQLLVLETVAVVPHLIELKLQQGALDVLRGELGPEVLLELGELVVLGQHQLQVAEGLRDLLHQEEGQVADLVGVVA
jgi:hypothetical protein